MKTFLICMSMYCFIIILNGQSCCDKKSLKVQGLGQNRIKPNIALIYASITQDGQTVTSAFADLDLTLDNITTEIQKNGLLHNDMRTTDLSIYPKYNFSNVENVVVGYTVYLSIAITIRGIDTNIERIAKIIDSLGHAGVTNITGLTYDTQDPKAGKQAARNKAYEDAVLKAKSYAEISGKKLGKAIILKQTSASHQAYATSSPSNMMQPVDSEATAQSQYRNAQAASGNGGYAPNIPEIPIGTVLILAKVLIQWQLI